MNSINWPVSSVLVFIAQLVEHCSVNAEATGSNPFEAPKKTFLRAISQLLKLRFTAMVTYSFHLYSRSSHHFILYVTFKNSKLICIRNNLNAKRNQYNTFSLLRKVGSIMN